MYHDDPSLRNKKSDQSAVKKVLQKQRKVMILREEIRSRKDENEEEKRSIDSWSRIVHCHTLTMFLER
jgi:hypothetical protein